MTTRIDPSLLARIPGLITPLNRVSALLQRLDIDQRLQGRVLAVRGSEVLISVFGEQIAAESLLPLQVGQLLDLMVRELRPDRITLQVVPESRDESPVLRIITNQDLRDLLASQHLPADPATLLIARTLIRNSLPVTAAIVLAARNALSFIEAPHPDDMDAAIFLLLKDLPVTPQSLELAKGALLQPNNLGARVHALAAQLLELLAQTEPGSAAATLPPRLLALVQQVLQDLPLLVPDHSQSQTFAALIPQVLDQIATPTERRLARLLEAARFIPPNPEIQPPPTVAKGAVNVRLQGQPSDGRPEIVSHDPSPNLAKTPTSAAGLTPSLAGFSVPEAVPIASRGDQPAEQDIPEREVSRLTGQRQEATASVFPERLLPEEPHQGLPAVIRHQPLEVTRDFRLQLALLKDELAQAAAELPRHHPVAPILQELQVTIREMLAMLEAEQLSNAGMPHPTQAQGYYVFHLPVAAAGQDAADTAEVRIYYQRQDHSKRVNPENAHLAFLLQMSHLGAVDVHVDLYQKHLRCRIECSNQEATKLFHDSTSELQERLQAVGYIVDSIHTVIADRPNTRSEGGSMPPLFTIDIRA